MQVLGVKNERVAKDFYGVGGKPSSGQNIGRLRADPKVVTDGVKVYRQIGEFKGEGLGLDGRCIDSLFGLSSGLAESSISVTAADFIKHGRPVYKIDGTEAGAMVLTFNGVEYISTYESVGVEK